VTNTIDEFRVFAESAVRLLTPEVGPTVSSEFMKFIREAAQSSISRAPAAPVAEFDHFVVEASRIVVAEIKSSLSQIAERAALASRWMVRHDLLDIAGFSFVENSYTELMAWALHPDTHPPSSHRRQQTWLKAMGLDERICGATECIPRTQLVTDDGIPDLVLQFENGVVIIETKTGSAEHAAPSGNPQTIAYPDAVRRQLNLPSNTQIQIVFITPNRRRAENENAKNTTFVEFVLPLAALLEKEDVPSDTRGAFAMLFTHFLSRAITNQVPVRELVERLAVWSKRPDWSADEQVLARRNDLLAAVDILLPEKTK
jgi:hypothetical protein